MFLSTAAGAGNMITLFLPLVVFFLLMYFMIMIPQMLKCRLPPAILSL